MKYVFTITERVFHDLTVEADSPDEAIRMAQDSITFGNFGVEFDSDIDFDYNYDAMQEANNA